MTSVFKNTREKITVHFIHDSTLNNIDKKKFLALAEKFDQKIIFYNVDEIFSKRIAEIKSKYDRIPGSDHWTIGAAYRLFAPEILPPEISKVIYLDADTLANLDILELWQIDIGDYPIAAKVEADTFPNESPYNLPEFAKHLHEIDLAVTNPKKLCDEFHLVKQENYFASDVMILNLEQIRKIFAEEGTTLIDASIEILTRYPLQYVDQDALNYLFSETCLHLPAKFNVFVGQVHNFFERTGLNEENSSWIYHYSGYNQRFDEKLPLDMLWLECLFDSGFFDLQMFLNVVEDYRKQLDSEREKIQSMLKQLGLHDLKISEPRLILTRSKGGIFKDERKIIFDM